MTRPSWIGQILGGRYRIDDLLGQGGMSAVYKAYDPNLKRTVALKMIHAHLAEDPKFIARFEEEAAAVAQLRHPNIVQVYDFNHDQDLYYMVQEFVPGETLQDKLRRLNQANRRMPLNEAIQNIIDICEATNFAHQRGMIHRDIKPANIMINVQGQAILMDFGIVKIMGGDKHTATGAVVGTALYLAPESIRGEAPDSRADQYSLAVTLFEMVSGHPPYEADSAMTLMMMHLNDPLPDLHGLRPNVPDNLIAVIEKALAKDRNQRYASMADFAHDLRLVLASLSNLAPGAIEPDQPIAQPVQGTPTYVVPNPAPAQPVSATLQPAPPLPTQAQPATPPPTAAPSAAVPAASTAAGSTGLPPASIKAGEPGGKPKLPRWAILGAGGVIGLVVIVVAVVSLLRGIGGSTAIAAEPTATETLLPTATAEVVILVPTETPTPSATFTVTPTSLPTLTPTITPSPTPTIPVGVPYARINDIQINERSAYVVDYETFEFTETLPGQHVHFFFNTVKPDQAGLPGTGPWMLYGGPRPFDNYLKWDRPSAAVQMCILVANPDHSVRQESGNCFTLPDVTAAVPIFNDPCLAGPGSAYPVVTQLKAGQVLLVTGLSPDEAWWIVAVPETRGETCWIDRSRSDFSGDISTLPLVEVPPLPTSTASVLSVLITGITLNAQGQYVVAFTTSGYTPALPGTHIHFFFDIFAGEQDGMTSNRLMYGGTSPFTSYSQTDRPQGATQLCALVANPDHTTISHSGNCWGLP